MLNRRNLPRHVVVLIVGLVVLFATYRWFDHRVTAMAPTVAQVNETLATGSRADALALLQASDEADSVRKIGLVSLGVEGVLLGVFLLRRSSD